MQNSKKRSIRKCSLFGYLEPVDNSEQEFLIDVTRDQCRRLHDTNSFRSMSFAGDAVDNSCYVGSYSDRFGTWNKVNVIGL